MSLLVSMYRGPVDRLQREIAQLEAKGTDERSKAAPRALRGAPHRALHLENDKSLDGGVAAEAGTQQREERAERAARQQRKMDDEQRRRRVEELRHIAIGRTEPGAAMSGRIQRHVRHRRARRDSNSRALIRTAVGGADSPVPRSATLRIDPWLPLVHGVHGLHCGAAYRVQSSRRRVSPDLDRLGPGADAQLQALTWCAPWSRRPSKRPMQSCRDSTSRTAMTLASDGWTVTATPSSSSALLPLARLRRSTSDLDGRSRHPPTAPSRQEGIRR